MTDKNKNDETTRSNPNSGRGQESHPPREEKNDQPASGNNPGINKRTIDEQTNTSGAGSSQRNKKDNVAPLDADLEQLPSEKRLDKGNLTGPGLG